MCRDVAQPGRALAWGARGRQFKSARPDHSVLLHPNSLQRQYRSRLPTASSPNPAYAQRMPPIQPARGARRSRAFGSSNLPVPTIFKINKLQNVSPVTNILSEGSFSCKEFRLFPLAQSTFPRQKISLLTAAPALLQIGKLIGAVPLRDLHRDLNLSVANLPCENLFIIGRSAKEAPYWCMIQSAFEPRKNA